MKIKGIVWLGTRTSKFDEMQNLYHNIMGLDIAYQEPGFVVMDLPNGDRVEVFGEESQYNMFFTHPVAGFLVDDIASARAEATYCIIPHMVLNRSFSSFLDPSSRLLVVSACSAKKCFDPRDTIAQLSARDLDDPMSRENGEKRLKGYCLSAAQMYTGDGHKFVRQAIVLLREHGFKLSHSILSAGYGLLNEKDVIAPYNVTFAGAPKSWIRNRGQKLDLLQKLINVAGAYDRVILILGREYFEALGLPLPTESLPRTLAYTAPSLANRIGQGVEVISVGQIERRAIGAYSLSAKEKLFLIDAQQVLQLKGNL